MQNPLLQDAVNFAARFHGDQKRKYTNEPYINHCLSVANIVSDRGVDIISICAAILHDTVEDTPATIGDIRKAFGYPISKLVEELTDVYTSEAYPELNRARRKALECERLGKISTEGQTIKLADLIDNTSSIVQYDPGFAKTYLKEKGDLLQVLVKGDKHLYKRASLLLNESISKLI